MSTKALNAILPLIASGQAYEAHQKARTFAARYSKSPAAGSKEIAIDVLFQSSRELLKAGQMGSGVDLGSYLLEVYEGKGEVVNVESRGRMTQLIALTGPEGAWRKTLIDKSIAWSIKRGKHPAGDPELHHYIGELLYKEGSLTLAEPHLLAAGQRDSARTLAQVMFDWSRGADPGKYASRSVVPYLQAGNILAARAFLQHFLSLATAARPSLLQENAPLPIKIPGTLQTDEIALTTDSTLNFLQLAVRTCQRARGAGDKERHARETWVRLCGMYNVTLSATSPEWRGVLISLSQLYFGLQAPRAQNSNPLQEMMSTFLGGDAPAASKPKVFALPLVAVEAGLD